MVEFQPCSYDSQAPRHIHPSYGDPRNFLDCKCDHTAHNCKDVWARLTTATICSREITCCALLCVIFVWINRMLKMHSSTLRTIPKSFRIAVNVYWWKIGLVISRIEMLMDSMRLSIVTIPFRDLIIGLPLFCKGLRHRWVRLRINIIYLLKFYIIDIYEHEKKQ